MKLLKRIALTVLLSLTLIIPAPAYAFLVPADSSPPPTSTTNNGAQDPAVNCTDNNCDLIAKYVNPFIDTLSICFGLIAVISIITGSISYITSEGDPQKSSRAKSRIFNTILAVVVYMFLFSFLQFVIPGGAFNR